MYIPLVTEWIANDGQKYDRQDCELRAFKRLAVRLKEYFPRLNICVLADGLYSNVSIMDVCHNNAWSLFNNQKNRGGALHHKFNRKIFDALKNWHSIRQLASMMLQLVIHARELQQLKAKSEIKITWKELWKNLNAFLTMCLAEELIDEFEVWSKVRRQVRLE